MKRQIFAIVAAVLLMSTPSWGVQSPKSKAPKPPKAPQLTVSKPVKSTTTTKVKPVSATKVKPVSAKSTAPKAKATKPVKTTTVKAVKSETKAVKPAKTTKAAKAETKKSTTTTATNTTTSTTNPNGTTTTLTPVQQKLERNTKLASKLESRLPNGTNLMDAADGFKNLGQFVAAVNVCYNHEGYEFKKLKALMVDEGFSLGQAMQKLKADLNTPDLARRAETDANRLITSTDPSGNTIVSTTPTTTTTTTTTATSKKTKKPVGGQQ